MRYRFLIISFFSIIIAQDYHGRCPEQPYGVPRSISAERDTFYITPDSTFKIHYDISGDLVPEDMSDDDSTGIPDYIESIGIAADSAKFILQFMGFDTVTVDEDGIYDIYIDIKHSSYNGLWGQTSPLGNSSYLRLRNGYSGLSEYCDDVEDLVWLTVGHEYFHAVQLEYNDHIFEPYFKELTSMWFENIFVPDCFDFLDFIIPLFDNPEKDFVNAIQKSSNSWGYSRALYGHYLGRVIDSTGTMNQMNGKIMYEIWEEYRGGNSALEAIDEVLYNKYNQKSFIETWVDFMSRNLYCGIYEDMNNAIYYHEGQAYIDPIQIYPPQTLENNINIEISLNDKSVSIQSFEIGDITSILEIQHNDADYIGTIALVSDNHDGDSLLLGEDIIIDIGSNLLFPGDIVHFVYATKSQNNDLIIDLNVYNVPLPPSNLQVKTTLLSYSSAEDSAELSWIKPIASGNILYYLIYRNDIMIDSSLTVDRDTLNYFDYGISGSYYYTYKVTCVNDNGESEPSNSVSIQSWPTADNVSKNQILSIFPNPLRKTSNSEILYALGSDYSNTTLELINIRGQIVKTILLKSYKKGWHRNSINNLVLPHLAAGLYIVRLRPDSGFGITQKIIILP